jgi:hypothetical protein
MSNIVCNPLEIRPLVILGTYMWPQAKLGMLAPYISAPGRIMVAIFLGSRSSKLHAPKIG